MGVVVKLTGAHDAKASLQPLVALVEEDMGHVPLDKRDERRKARCRIAGAGKLNHNSQGTYS